MEYKTIYEYLNNGTKHERDDKVYFIAKILGKRFYSVEKNLARENFRPADKTVIILKLKEKGVIIPNEDTFFDKE